MIGVDYGVRRISVGYPRGGWSVALDLTKGEHGRRLKGAERGEELVELQEFLRLAVGGLDGPIFIESPIGGLSGNMQTLAGMAETCGALMTCFPRRTHKVAPSSWKALVCGNGSLDKAGVSAWLEREHAELYAACLKPSGKADQDRVDAACLGLCTVDGLAERSRMPRKRARPVLRSGPAAPDVPCRGR